MLAATKKDVASVNGNRDDPISEAAIPLIKTNHMGNLA